MGWQSIFHRTVFAEHWLERRREFESVRFRHRSTSKSSVPGVDASNESGLFFARAIKSEIGQ
jgi:hypothetical protein